MSFETSCPNCTQVLRVEDQYAGQAVRCPRCSQVMMAPPLGPPAQPTSHHAPPGGYGYQPPFKSTNSKAIAALVLGILSISMGFAGVILGPIAIGLAGSAMREIAADPNQTGEQLATAGRIMGIIGLILGLCCCGLAPIHFYSEFHGF